MSSGRRDDGARDPGRHGMPDPAHDRTLTNGRRPPGSTAGGAMHGPDGLPSATRTAEAARLAPPGPAPSPISKVLAVLRWVAGSWRRCAGDAARWEQPGSWNYATEPGSGASSRDSTGRDASGARPPRHGTGAGMPAPGSH